MNQKKGIRFINSFWLHLLAMALMLCDHMWGTIMRGNDWMTTIGRLAFPIFAFLLVEGFFHTKNLKKYELRLLIGAVLSEIPFNLMLGGYWLDPFEQNVMWTFLIAIICMQITEKLKKKNEIIGTVAGVLIFGIGAMLGFVTFVDYFGYGVIMVAVFYFFRGNQWWKMVLQAAGLILINCVWYKGLIIDISLFGQVFEMKRQGFAVLALLPIWLYNGEKGPGGKAYQYFCYLFYPVHILILSLISLYVL